jgi:hypothetical protein
MEQRLCKSCNKTFTGDDEICNECKINKGGSDDKMNKLAGTIEALAVMRSYKEVKK